MTTTFQRDSWIKHFHKISTPDGFYSISFVIVKENGITPASDRFQDFLKFFFGKVYPNKKRRLRRHILKVDNPPKSDTVKIRKREFSLLRGKFSTPNLVSHVLLLFHLVKLFFFNLNEIYKYLLVSFVLAENKSYTDSVDVRAYANHRHKAKVNMAL